MLRSLWRNDSNYKISNTLQLLKKKKEHMQDVLYEVFGEIMSIKYLLDYT